MSARVHSLTCVIACDSRAAVSRAKAAIAHGSNVNFEGSRRSSQVTRRSSQASCLQRVDVHSSACGAGARVDTGGVALRIVIAQQLTTLDAHETRWPIDLLENCGSRVSMRCGARYSNRLRAASFELHRGAHASRVAGLRFAASSAAASMRAHASRRNRRRALSQRMTASSRSEQAYEYCGAVESMGVACDWSVRNAAGIGISSSSSDGTLRGIAFGTSKSGASVSANGSTSNSSINSSGHRIARRVDHRVGQRVATLRVVLRNCELCGCEFSNDLRLVSRRVALASAERAEAASRRAQRHDSR